MSVTRKIKEATDIAKGIGRLEILEELNEDYTMMWTYQDIAKWIKEKVAEA